jgi:drug/metabolite transporter (DMT)-like permease
MVEKRKAIIYMLISSLAFATMGAFVKLAGDLPTVQKVFSRNFISMIIAGSIVLYNKKPLFGERKNLKYLLIRSTLGTAGMLAYFYSIDHLLLSDSSMLNKLNPFFVSIFAFFILKEKFSKIQIPALFIAFTGAVFIIKPEFDMSVIPALLGLSSAVLAAGAYTTVRFLGGREEFYTIVFFFSFFSTMATLPLMVAFFEPMNWNQVLFLVLTGIVASIGQFTLTIAYKHAPAGEISILNYTNVLFSGIIGYFLFDSIPDFLSIVGYALIISAAFLIYINANRKNKKLS